MNELEYRATLAGMNAFLRGEMRVPAHNAEMCAIIKDASKLHDTLKTESIQRAKNISNLLTRWLNAWDEANLA